MSTTRSRLLGGLIALRPLPALAHDGRHDHDHAPRPVADAEAHRPTAIPDRIILTFAGDPARSNAVNWRTDAGVGKAIAQIAPADAGPKFVERARTIDATSTPLTTDLGQARYHSVDFEGLAPATHATPTASATAPTGASGSTSAPPASQPEPFSFIYFGDAQNDIKSLWSRVIREAYSDAPKARFIVHAGDLVNRANSDAEWGEWFGGRRLGQRDGAQRPDPRQPRVREAEGPRRPGRADRRGPKAEPPAKASPRHWRPQFTLPENGPAGLEETVYSLDYQGPRIISLNSNERQPRSRSPGSRTVLGDNPNRWTIVTFHHPIYSAAKGRDNPSSARLWQPVFDSYRVDLVLQGHDHTYARSGLRARERATGPPTATTKAGRSTSSP